MTLWHLLFLSPLKDDQSPSLSAGSLSASPSPSPSPQGSNLSAIPTKRFSFQQAHGAKTQGPNQTDSICLQHQKTPAVGLADFSYSMSGFGLPGFIQHKAAWLGASGTSSSSRAQARYTTFIHTVPNSVCIMPSSSTRNYQLPLPLLCSSINVALVSFCSSQYAFLHLLLFHLPRHDAYSLSFWTRAPSPPQWYQPSQDQGIRSSP